MARATAAFRVKLNRLLDSSYLGEIQDQASEKGTHHIGWHSFGNRRGVIRTMSHPMMLNNLRMRSERVHSKTSAP